MGYYVTIQQSTFKIPAENLKEAYERMCQLNFTVPNLDKRGGTWPGKNQCPEYGPDKSSWFSWMSWNYHETCKDAEAVLQEIGFDVWYDADGALLIQGYDSKSGQEDLFLNAICPLATGYIVWRGEEGELWGETYGGSSVIIKERSASDYSDLVTDCGVAQPMIGPAAMP